MNQLFKKISSFKSKRVITIIAISLIGLTATTLSFCQNTSNNMSSYSYPCNNPKINCVLSPEKSHQYLSDLNAPFDLIGYFTGKTTGHGFFQKRSGEIVKRFRVNLNGVWTPKNLNYPQAEGTLVLNEEFYYDDGSRQTRVWTILKKEITTQEDSKDIAKLEIEYEGTAGDIVGVAKGKENNSQLTWNYTMALPVDGTIYNVKFNDVMVRMNEKTVVNRAVMSKLGFELGQVILTFEKP